MGVIGNCYWKCCRWEKTVADQEGVSILVTWTAFRSKRGWSEYIPLGHEITMTAISFICMPVERLSQKNALGVLALIFNCQLRGVYKAGKYSFDFYPFSNSVSRICISTLSNQDQRTDTYIASCEQLNKQSSISPEHSTPLYNICT